MDATMEYVPLKYNIRMLTLLAPQADISAFAPQAKSAAS
jgi:hypothetical protein